MRRIAVVGASLAGLEAAVELRRSGFDGELVIAGREAHMPYDRPPLSKELLTGRLDEEAIRLVVDERLDAEWRLGVAATSLDAGRRTIRFDHGAAEKFDGIVLATGAAARRPRLSGEGDQPMDGIHVLRTLDDALALRAELRREPGRVVVVGAGFIGAEVASSCRLLGLDVSVIEALAVPMEPAVGPVAGAVLAGLQRDHGVDLRLRTSLSGVCGTDRVEAVRLSDGDVLAADVVVLAIGVTPATDWLAGSGLIVDQGVVCDETCLAAPGIVAAGDVASWPNRRFGAVARIEHWDNASRQGRHAARRLLHGDAGTGFEAFEPVPWFWSDQFGCKLQLVGSARDFEEFAVVFGSLESRRFVGAYRRADRLIGAVALNAGRPLLGYRRLLARGASWAEALSLQDGSFQDGSSKDGSSKDGAGTRETGDEVPLPSFAEVK
jgi:3-phenylpropionate/trans-cinnamate dioxygenase ferredoxin reductase component